MQIKIVANGDDPKNYSPKRILTPTENNNHSEDTKRIAKNTMALYIRMFFTMIISLYTSRVLLNALGVEDFGLYNVVGGLVAMFSLISGTLSNSVSRFLTFQLGKGDKAGIKIVFSTSIMIHIALAIVVVIALETLGVWFLNAKMVIPNDRMIAANWVFQASLISFAISLIGVPYNACIIAHERMTAFAYIGIIQVFLNLINVLFIAYYPAPINRLICYSLITLVVSIIIQITYIIYCRKNFFECKELKFMLNKHYWRDIIAFSSWNFIGSLASRLKWDGVNILLNLFFGTVVNASRGIAGSVNGAVTAFATNFTTAINPQITKSYASGDISYMQRLVSLGSRYSYYILFIIVLPLILETNFVITLWLKQFPENTIIFTQLTLVLTLTDIIANPLITAQLATGKVKFFQLIVGSILLLNFPLSYFCLALGSQPQVVFYIAIGISVMSLYIRLLFLKHYINFSIKKYSKDVILNIILVTIVSSFIPTLLHNNMHCGWLRFIIIVLLCTIITSLTIFFLGCSKNERKFLISKITSRS